jgi:hypothetical protein
VQKSKGYRDLKLIVFINYNRGKDKNKVEPAVNNRAVDVMVYKQRNGESSAGPPSSYKESTTFWLISDHGDQYYKSH